MTGASMPPVVNLHTPPRVAQTTGDSCEAPIRAGGRHSMSKHEEPLATSRRSRRSPSSSGTWSRRSQMQQHQDRKGAQMRSLLCAVIALAWAAVAVADDGAKVTPGKPVEPAGSGPIVGKGSLSAGAEVNLSPKVPPL